MTSNAVIVLFATVLVTLIALAIAGVAGFLAHHDGASHAQCIVRAAKAFAATVTLAAVIAATLHSLIG